MENVVSVFFDLEKAYDTTWKYGIMKDLHDMDLPLPLFIQNFLSEGKFRVRVGTSLSQGFEFVVCCFQYRRGVGIVSFF